MIRLPPPPPPPQLIPPPPPPPLPLPLPVPVKQHGFQTHSRRNATNILMSLLTFNLLPVNPFPPPATAFALGISGPKEWLKEQKKKASRFLLAPIYASRQTLQTAYHLLDSESHSSDDLGEVQGLVKAASRGCVPQDRNSFVAFQSQAGVEVCTFRLIVKNASSLLDDKNPVKLETEAMLGDLIRSFISLNGAMKTSDLQVAPDRKKVENELMNAISALEKFEQGIKDCLDV